MEKRRLNLFKSLSDNGCIFCHFSNAACNFLSPVRIHLPLFLVVTLPPNQQQKYNLFLICKN